jgi:hypothetical protein
LPKPFFDNVKDVNDKFRTTICYYKEKAVYIKSVEALDNKEFVLFTNTLGGKTIPVHLRDPELNYVLFNIGYVNHKSNAVWWFRRPIKQYQQGLKREQMAYITDSSPDVGFGFVKPFIHMLENKYPYIEICATLIAQKDSETRNMAFHKDFALLWDDLHQNHVLQYRAHSIGVSLDSKLSKFRLKDEFTYLFEALEEALCTV